MEWCGTLTKKACVLLYGTYWKWYRKLPKITENVWLTAKLPSTLKFPLLSSFQGPQSRGAGGTRAPHPLLPPPPRSTFSTIFKGLVRKVSCAPSPISKLFRGPWFLNTNSTETIWRYIKLKLYSERHYWILNSYSWKLETDIMLLVNQNVRNAKLRISWMHPNLTIFSFDATF